MRMRIRIHERILTVTLCTALLLCFYVFLVLLNENRQSRHQNHGIKARKTAVDDLLPSHAHNVVYSQNTLSCVGSSNEQRNIVYIKMFKSASTTMSTVFRRFGIVHNLSFVLPIPKRFYVGWPYVLDDTLYRWVKLKGAYLFVY